MCFFFFIILTSDKLNKLYKYLPGFLADFESHAELSGATVCSGISLKITVN